MLKERIEELLQEKKARAEIRSAALTFEKKKKIKGPEKKELERWREKRAAWVRHCTECPGYSAPAGEIANMLDGLTPDGYDKKGRKVSFVEQGRSSTKPLRISSKPVYCSKE